jgi:glutamate/aspartate transport system substrate-binding protein
MSFARTLSSAPAFAAQKGPINWLHKKNKVEENLMRIVPHILGAAIAAALISTASFRRRTHRHSEEDQRVRCHHPGPSRRVHSVFLHCRRFRQTGRLLPRHPAESRRSDQKDLDLPNLQVKYNLVTSQTRIPLVQNGTVDLECGSTTNNVERQQQVDFSVGIFEIGTRLLSKADSKYKDFPDLAGKNVVTTAGTTSERILKAMNADKQMGMNVISAKDHGESFQMLETGRAVAFMMDDALLAGEAAKAKKPPTGP